MKLDGIRVVDLSMFLPGPMVSQMMADHGAEVIHVENPKGGEPGRHIGYRQAGETVFFRNTHRGKKSLALNLKVPEAKEALLRLCDTADVFIESFRPGVVQRLGLGYEVLKARNPGLVYCSIAAFGQDGPMRDRPSHDMGTAALAGIVGLNRAADGSPAIPGIACSDMGASLTAFGAVMMALVGRARSGQGDYVDIAMHDVLMTWEANVTGPVFAEDRAPVLREERSLGGGALYNIYETADGRHVVLAGSEEKFVRNLFTALDAPQFIEPCSGPPGPAHWPAIDYLRGRFKEKTQAEWLAALADVDVCFQPVLDLKEAWDHPQVKARGMLVHDAEGTPHIGNPVKYREEPAQLDFRLAGLGQHNAEILGGLGYGEGDLAALRDKGAF